MTRQTLRRLVYCSRNEITGSTEQVNRSIRQILEVARRDNPCIGVTGALMFNGDAFGQVLEGPDEVVETLFERIQQDPRHGHVHLLAFDRVPSRTFAHWSMAFVGASQADFQRFGDIAPGTGFDPLVMSGDALLTTLNRLVFKAAREAVLIQV